MPINQKYLKDLIGIIEKISTLSTLKTKDQELDINKVLEFVLENIVTDIGTLSENVLYNNEISELLSENVKDAIDELSSLIDDIEDNTAVDIPVELPLLNLNVQEELEDLNNKINIINNYSLRVTWFDIINTQTGQVSNIPANANFELGKFEGLDAILSDLNSELVPNYVSPRDINGDIISVSSFDVNGNYSLDLIPQGDIAILYSYSIALKDFNHTKQLDSVNLDPVAEEIAARYEGLNNTNKFTDADKNKVGLIEVTTSTDLDQVKSDISNKESKFNKNTAFNKNFGSDLDTVTQGNDDRLSNERVPFDNSVSTVKLQNNSVSNQKLSSVAENTIKGRASSGTGIVEDLSSAQLKQILSYLASEIAVNNSGFTEYLSSESNLQQISEKLDAIGKDIIIQDSTVTAVTGSNISPKINTQITIPSSGNYIIDINYTWNSNSDTDDIYVRCLLENIIYLGDIADGNGNTFIHREESKDIGGGLGTEVQGTASNQRYNFSRKFIYNFSSSGSKDFLLEFGTPSFGETVYMWGVLIKIHKVL